MASEDFNGSDGWIRYQKLVLNELERHETKLDEIPKEITKLRQDMTKELSAIKTDITMLKVKSGLWGAAAGALSVIAAIFLKFLFTGTVG